MSNLTKVWMPDGQLSEGQRHLLSVAVMSKPEQSLYRSLLLQKLAALINHNEKAARRALDMSQEHAPELWSIAAQHPPKDWAAQLVYSDGMMALLGKVDWDGPGGLQEAAEQSLLEIVEQLA